MTREQLRAMHASLEKSAEIFRREADRAQTIETRAAFRMGTAVLDALAIAFRAAEAAGRDGAS